PAPLHALLSVQRRLGSPEQRDARLPKKSQSWSVTPSQFDSSPLIVEPVCTWKLCAMPVHPVSRSAPGVTTNVSWPRAGHVQTLEHCPGHKVSSVPSQSSPCCRMLSPQNGAHVQSP